MMQEKRLLRRRGWVSLPRVQRWLSQSTTVASTVAASCRFFQEATDLSTGVQRGVNTLQKKWPNQVKYNSICINALASPRCFLGPVSLVKGQALSTGRFLSLGLCRSRSWGVETGEKGQVCLVTELPAGPWASPHTVS